MPSSGRWRLRMSCGRVAGHWPRRVRLLVRALRFGQVDAAEYHRLPSAAHGWHVWSATSMLGLAAGAYGEVTAVIGCLGLFGWRCAALARRHSAQSHRPARWSQCRRLLAGSFGVVAAMLAAVAQRRGEIALRMAVGARRRDIAWQFLAESMTVGLAGALAGAALGFATGAALETAMTPVAFAPWVVASAICGSVAVSVLFGIVPARRAAAVDAAEDWQRKGRGRARGHFCFALTS